MKYLIVFHHSEDMILCDSILDLLNQIRQLDSKEYLDCMIYTCYPE